MATTTAPAANHAEPTEAAAVDSRFYALDALRGVAIALMIFVNWAGNYELPPAFGHSEWHGITLADTVFPGFLVAMGTAMPYARRTGWRRAFGRAAMLYLIGSALVSFKYDIPFQLSVGVLQLIGVTYLVSWMILKTPRVAQLVIVVGLVVGVTLAYLWPPMSGVAAGFEPETNAGEWFDAMLGMSPHPENPHAWIPAVGSVFIGVLAGRISQESTGRRRLVRLAILGAVTLGLGLLISPVVPPNKYLWTASFILITGGIAILALVVLALLIPSSSRGGPLRPFVILGGHAIVVYAFSETVIGRAHGEWIWPELEPVVTERWGEVAAGAAFPLAAVVVSLLLAWVMERFDIRIRL